MYCLYCSYLGLQLFVHDTDQLVCLFLSKRGLTFLVSSFIISIYIDLNSILGFEMEFLSTAMKADSIIHLFIQTSFLYTIPTVSQSKI